MPQTTSLDSKKPTKKVASKSNTANFSKKTIEQVTLGLKKYKKIITVAKEKGLNESDTSNVINDMLSDIFGFEKMIDITTEYKIKGQYCDYGLRINNKLVLLLEAKAIGIDLNENHIYQASSYASSEGVKRVVLTNLREWRLYHLSFGSKIENNLVFSVDLLGDVKSNKIQGDLNYLHKESFLKGYIEKLWLQKSALSATNLRKILLAKPMVKKVQLELAKITKVKVSETDILSLLDKIIQH